MFLESPQVLSAKFHIVKLMENYKRVPAYKTDKPKERVFFDPKFDQKKRQRTEETRLDFLINPANP